MQLASSFRVIRPINQVLQSVLRRNVATQIKSKINFNTKHLKKGDPLPPYNGKLRIYNMRYCPYAQRTILALNAKQIDYEVVNVNLVEKPEWLYCKSAFNKVPALEIEEGVTVYESLVSVEYLDDVYPQRPLLPKDPVKKAHDKTIVEACGSIHTIFYRTLRSPEKVTEGTVFRYHKSLDFVQDALKSRGTRFLDGEEPGYADYMIWPWFERILVIQDENESLNIDPEKYKLLMEYLKNMERDPAISLYSVPRDIIFKFTQGYKQNPPNPNYDLLTEE